MALYVNGKVVSGGGGNAGYQELTYDEYMALTPEQKTDGTMYFLTDVNGDDSQFQPVIYSETEREIGVWTDGKPLYQKAIFISTALSNGVWNNDALGTVGSNISIVDFMGFIYGDTLGDGAIFPLNYFRTTSEFVTTITNLDGDDLNILPTIPDVGTLYIKYIVIRYTKTTDTAGSGTWTPQGVPAIHYSQSEQVIGTWYDGSTLYEQTLYFNNKKLTTSESTSQLVHNISNIGSVKFVESAYTDFENGTWVTATNCIAAGTVYPVGWVVTATKIYVRSTTNEFSAAANRSYLITVRYTKASS